jgi:hypothetical protein
MIAGPQERSYDDSTNVAHRLQVYRDPGDWSRLLGKGSRRRTQCRDGKSSRF